LSSLYKLTFNISNEQHLSIIFKILGNGGDGSLSVNPFRLCKVKRKRAALESC
jgi:hypothetical protein